MAINEYNSDLDIKGKLLASIVPNSTGSIVTWNASTNVFGLRTNAQIISDLNLSSSFIPYTGATANVNLGARSITSTGGFIGNASTATKLASITTTFTGSYPVTVNVNGVIYSHEGLSYTGSTGALTATTFIGALSGNASTATKLATARTINGTSFNGSANITTTSWGTSRNITIGNTTKSVNGSGNVSWSLAEIGAASSTSLNNYVPYTGATQTVNLGNQRLQNVSSLDLTNNSMTYPNALNSDSDAWNQDSKNYFSVSSGNNKLAIIGESTSNKRTFGIQVGHTTPAFANSVGVLELQPLHGNVSIGSLAGTGTRMVATTSTGILISQALPVIPTASDYITTNTNQGGLSGNKITSGTWVYSSTSATPITLQRSNSSGNSTISFLDQNSEGFNIGLANKDTFGIGSSADINNTANRWMWVNSTGRIYSKNDGDSSQWKQAYDWGDFRDYGLGVTTQNAQSSINGTLPSSLWTFGDTTQTIGAPYDYGGVLTIRRSINEFTQLALPVQDTLSKPPMYRGKLTSGEWDWRKFITEVNLNTEATALGFIKLSDLSGYVPTSRTLTAGNGLSGGGTLAANRTITLGTPTAIGLSTTNSVTSTSHTHALDSATTTAINNGQTAFGWGDFREWGLGTTGRTPTQLGAPDNDMDLIPRSTTGFFYGGNNALNRPINSANSYPMGIHVGLNQNIGVQLSIERDGTVYTRGSSGNNAWNPWVMQWNNSNFDPSTKQNTLTAGTNITISGNTISATNTNTVTRLRGTASGTYTSGDLTLLAGANTTITQSGANITIASTNTNTTYSAGTGLSLTGTTFANTAPNATHTGDVTGSTALTIANSAVTHAKYQNIATQRILGRGATGTGNVQELTLGANLSLSTAGVLSATNTNTTYTAGNGLTLSGTAFSLPVTNSGTGNYVTNVVANANGLTVTKATLPSQLQTLSVGGSNQPGMISISGGNSVELQDLMSASRPDANVRIKKHSLIPYYSTAGSTNYPQTISTGIRLERLSSATNQLGFDINLGSDSVLRFKTFSGEATESNWFTFYHSGNFANGTTLQYIRGDGSLATMPAIPTVNNGKLTLSTGTGLSGSANFTANQAGSSSFSVAVASTHKLPTTTEWDDTIKKNKSNTVTENFEITDGFSTLKLGSGSFVIEGEIPGVASISLGADDGYAVFYETDDGGYFNCNTYGIFGKGGYDWYLESKDGGESKMTMPITGTTERVLTTGAKVGTTTYYANTQGVIELPAYSTYKAGTGLSLSGTTFSVKYGTAAGTAAQGNDSRINNGQTAFGWGNHINRYVGGTTNPLADPGTYTGTHSALPLGSYTAILSTGVSGFPNGADGGFFSFGRVGNNISSRIFGSRQNIDGLWYSNGDPLTATIHQVASREWVNSQLSSYVPTSRTLTAGNGLSGGGNLTANRTITLGTPSAITLSSTNSVAASSHTHAFTPGGTTAQYIRGDGSLATYVNTTYAAGNGLTLSGTTFSLPVVTSGSGNAVTAVAQSANGITVTKGITAMTTSHPANDITEAYIINWNDAFTNSHSHSNKSYLDSINQNLGTSSSPTFIKINNLNLKGRGSLGSPLDVIIGNNLSNYVFGDIGSKDALATFRIESNAIKDGNPVFGRYGASILAQTGDTMFTLSANPNASEIFVSAGNTTNNILWNKKLAFTVNEFTITATAFYESSLKKFKTNIKPFNKSGVELINSLDIVTFDRIDDKTKNKIGVIADDTSEEFLSEDKDAVDLYKTIFIQAKAIQELDKNNKTLEERINQLERIIKEFL